MEIRQICQADIGQLAEMEKMCFSDPWSESAFAYELRNPLSLWLVAVEDELVVGYVGSQTVMDESDMMNLAVLPSHRRQGIGEKLVQSLCSDLRAKGSVSLTLEVRVSNAGAISLYKKMGFVQVGLRPNYYRNPKEDALILRKELA